MQGVTENTRDYGQVVTETQRDTYLEQMLDDTYRMDSFARYFGNAVAHSFCAVPDEE